MLDSNETSSFYLFFVFVNCSAQEEPKTFKVMAWNILHGANDIENGPQNAIQIIEEIDPDVILMIETYGSGKMIADSLGLNFHLVAPKGTALDDKSTNLSIYSKFPFGERLDTEFPFYLGGTEILIRGQKIRFLTNWFHYLPWNDEPEKMGKTVEELLEWERTETRYSMIQKILPYLKNYTAEADSIPLIFGGDMNSPSHLDWGLETKRIHKGLVVPWYSTKILEDIGLIDSYRAINESPIASPGITWDAIEKNDEHRIDYIFYKGSKLKAVASKSYMAFLNEPIIIHGKSIIYPSDHGIVVTLFEY